jgi:gliding motility-associated-like protein
MKQLFLLIAVFLSLTANSQYCPYLGPDQFLPCGVGSTTLTADLSQCGPGGANPNQTTNYSVTNIPYVAQTNTGTSITMSDDSQQGPFPIGFNFCFYGSTYTQFYIGSNGWISFSGGQPTTFTSAPLPTANALVPKNCIMGPWQDWHPGLGGQIRYQTSGVAPCRKLTVSWIGVPMFSCSGNTGTFHIVINESTNYIENYIQSKPACLQWQGGTAVEGIHNAPGSAAVTVPGRNSTAWTANNDAWRWVPSGPAVVPVLTWYQVGNPVAIGTGPTINVTPPPAGANYTCRFVYPICNAGWATCNAGIGLGPDTVFVQPGPPNLPLPNVFFSDPLCSGSCDGAIVITPNGGTGVINISWNIPGTNFSQINLCSGVYSYNLIDAAGCTYNSTVTLTNPPVPTVGPIVYSDTVCFESTDEIYSVPDQGPGWSYIWSSVGSIITQQGNDSIHIDWSSTAPGFIPGAVDVISVNPNGCLSLPVSADIELFYLDVVIPLIGPFCSTDNCEPLVGLPLGGVFSGTGVNGSDFCPSLAALNDEVYYTYTQSGCTFIDSIGISVNPQPLITQMSPDNLFIELCEGDSSVIAYSITSTLPGSVTWTVGNEVSVGSNSIGTVWETFGMYVISAYITTAEGCVSPEVSTALTIQECPQELIYIPNAFTANADEYNSAWQPVFTSGFDPYEYHAMIFNRWGNVVWESYNHQSGWDGSYNGYYVPDGIYVYMITYGNPKDDGRNVLQGHITLIR